MGKKVLEILRAIQDGIPITPEPFAEVSKTLGMSEDDLLEKLIKLKEKGIIRRFGANINQRKVGITANAVVVWKIPPEKVDRSVETMVECPEISHCYERRTIPGKWEYNLFTVVHDYDKESIDRFVKQLSRKVGIKDYQILFSTRRFKGTSTKLSDEKLSM